MVSPPQWRRVASWICGWFYLVGNVTIIIAVNFATTTLFISCINIFGDEKNPLISGDAYQIFLMYLAITLLCTATSTFGNRWLPLLDVRYAPSQTTGILTRLLVAAPDHSHLRNLCRRCSYYGYNLGRC